MNYRIEPINSQISPIDVERLESAVGSKLPTGYRKFLLSHNGGVPYNNTFDVPSATHEGRYLYSFSIKQFLGLTVRGHDDLLRVYTNLQRRLPSDLLPIAIDNFRNFMCLSLLTGQVYFFDLQSVLKAHVPEHQTAAQHLYPVAASFDELMERLYHKKFT